MSGRQEEQRLEEFGEAILRQPDFSFIKKILENYHGSEVFLVGGAVRDALLDREGVKDFDFVVRGVPIAKLQAYFSREGVVDLVGKNFGVLKFKPFDGHFKIPFDIALPRSEHAFLNGGGYRDFVVQANPDLAIESDLSRRDFTINALAWDFKNKKLVDPFGGLNDLREKTIRAVGEPSQRFQEDYSRMLRAIRFACQLNFQIAKETWAVLKKNIKNINREKDGDLIVPRETIGSEFLKAFYHNPVRALDLYEESGALKEIAPELLAMQNCPQPENFHSEGDVWTHTRIALAKLNSPEFKKQFGDEYPSANLVMAVLLHDTGKPATIETPEKDGADRIRFSNHDAIGSHLAEVVGHRLKLNNAIGLDFDTEETSWLVANHMITMQGDIDRMKNSTIEKYFFSQRHNSEDLLKLIFADASATVPEKGQPNMSNFKSLLYRMEQIKELGIDRAGPPPKLIDGDIIMKILDLHPGQLVGKVLTIVREEQLRGKIKTEKEAKQFVKKLRLTDL